jgi:hypothetical protein
MLSGRTAGIPDLAQSETLACETRPNWDRFPRRTLLIRKRARYAVPEILEIEKRTNHDVIAFLESVWPRGPAAR